MSENLRLRCLFLQYYEHLFLFSILKLHVTSSRFCLYLLNIYHLTYTFHMHIQRHTHTSTYVQSAHKRNCDNQAQEPGWEGRKRGFVRDIAHTHTKKNVRKNPIFTSLKKRFEHIELPAKLLNYFLRNNKSNINQSIEHRASPSGSCTTPTASWVRLLLHPTMGWQRLFGSIRC